MRPTADWIRYCTRKVHSEISVETTQKEMKTDKRFKKKLERCNDLWDNIKQ